MGVPPGCCRHSGGFYTILDTCQPDRLPGWRLIVSWRRVLVAAGWPAKAARVVARFGRVESGPAITEALRLPAGREAGSPSPPAGKAGQERPLANLSLAGGIAGGRDT